MGGDGEDEADTSLCGGGIMEVRRRVITKKNWGGNEITEGIEGCCEKDLTRKKSVPRCTGMVGRDKKALQT